VSIATLRDRFCVASRYCRFAVDVLLDVLEVVDLDFAQPATAAISSGIVSIGRGSRFT
jgi:hypothetical protein